MAQLNLAQADAARVILAAHPGMLVGSNFHLLVETRLGARLGTRWAARTIGKRASLALLAPDHPAGAARAGAEASEGDCWWTDADEVGRAIGVTETIECALRPEEKGRQLSSAERAVVVARYRRRFVAPRVRAFEQSWAAAKREELPSGEPLSYKELCPVLANGVLPPWGIGLGWAPWGPTDWKYYRAWALARISFAIPLTVWDAGSMPAHLPHCPCCGKAQVDLGHVVTACPETAGVRSKEWPGCDRPASLMDWLAGVADVDILRRKVRVVGRCCGRVAAALVTTETAEGRARGSRLPMEE
jgi:hypothetical protein